MSAAASEGDSGSQGLPVSPPPAPPWEPIPQEGAWFRPGPRTADLSCVTVLLTNAPDGFSALHALTITEGWQWLGGHPVELTVLHPDGSAQTHLLGPENPQAIVPPHAWQGARTLGTESQVACWCTPPFVDGVFTLGERAALEASHPASVDVVRALTREAP